MSRLPVLAHAALVGALVAGFLASAVGLLVGLHVHPATAWFAVLELGVPGAALGAALGSLVGVVQLWRAAGHRGPRGA